MPNELWGRPGVRHWFERPMDDDFTFVSTWRGFVSFRALSPRHWRDGRPSSCVIDTFANRIVGPSRVISFRNTLTRCPKAHARGGSGSRQSMRVDQIYRGVGRSRAGTVRRRHRLSDRWRSSAAVGDSYDNALVETIMIPGAYAATLGPRSPSIVQNRGHYSILRFI